MVLKQNSTKELKKIVKHLNFKTANFVKFLELQFISSKYLFYNFKTLRINIVI
jgi:hypothetical protein